MTRPRGRRIRHRRISGLVLLIGLMIVVLLLSGPPASAQDDQQKVVKSPPWNFGYLLQKSEVSHRFFLYNGGPSPLTVLKIKAGCSCTSVSRIDRPIAPGDSAAIEVTFKSGRYHGPVKKTTKVFTDNPEGSVHHLPIMANIVKRGEPTGDVSVTPQKLTWKLIEEKIEKETDTLRVTNGSAGTLAAAVMCVPEDLVSEIELPASVAAAETAYAFVHISEMPVSGEMKGLSATFAFIGEDTTFVTVPIEVKK